MFRYKTLPLVIFFFTAAAFAQQPAGGRMIDGKLYHLGDSVIDTWPGISANPEGTNLVTRFDAEENKQELTLKLTYWDVNFAAAVKLNGKKIDVLMPSQTKKSGYVRIVPGALKTGENVLIISPSPTDDCVIGELEIFSKSFSELMGLRPVQIRVSDTATGKPVPARVTIVSTNGSLANLFLAPTNGTAVRNGLIYTLGTETPVYLAKGEYVFYATRGMEWSRDKQSVSIQSGKTTQVNLAIQREVNTKGYIAADTHLHTVTFSGHGDASVDERMITLAGEGVELAVSTDHNHQTDYRPYQEKMAVTEFFTPITGNEVTTKGGHFNSFPLPPEGPIPDKNEADWVKLIDDIRAKGAKVVILNHPRWQGYDAFNGNGLNPITGSRTNGVRITFDGLELINSTATLTNGFILLRDWLALLNHGEKIQAVGSSDSHTVDSPVGQGRTYIRSSTDVASKIKVDEVITNFLAGQSSVSMGIYTEVSVNKKFVPGQIVPTDRSFLVRLRVAAPSWITPKRAFVFVNGAQVAEKEIPVTANKATDLWLDFTLPSPRHDAHLVCFIVGEGVHEPCWKTQQDYTLAATNPVYLDADRDGAYRSPRETAKGILSKTERNIGSEMRAVMQLDDGIATQMLDLIYAEADDAKRAVLAEELQKMSSERNVFGEFLKSVRGNSVAGG